MLKTIIDYIIRIQRLIKPSKEASNIIMLYKTAYHDLNMLYMTLYKNNSQIKAIEPKIIIPSNTAIESRRTLQRIELYINSAKHLKTLKRQLRTLQ